MEDSRISTCELCARCAIAVRQHVESAYSVQDGGNSLQDGGNEVKPACTLEQNANSHGFSLNESVPTYGVPPKNGFEKNRS